MLTTSTPLPARPRPVPAPAVHSALEDTALFISHELRTPLTSIQCVLGLLHAGQIGSLSEEGQHLLAIALNNTDRLTRLINMIERGTVAPVTPISSVEMEQLQLENDLHQALTHQQFWLEYQPVMEVESGRVAGFEALLRWQHPTRGSILPIVFIPIAERTGLIHQLGLWVLQQSCQQLAKWQKQFPSLSDLSISVNLSALQLLKPDLLPQIQQIIQNTRIDPHCLKLEITETALINDYEMAFSLLTQLRQMGVQIYIDDFGTGYSSLSRLQDLPIDALKIDRSFIRFKRWDISEAIITLAGKLGLTVIAEGVETPEDSFMLQRMGCRYMQGYCFSAPINTTGATAFLASYLSSSLSHA